MIVYIIVISKGNRAKHINQQPTNKTNLKT